MSLPEGVGATAVAVAHWRATESGRSDRLFDDRWAKHFVAASGWSPPSPHEITGEDDMRGADSGAWVVVRTCFIDRAITEAVETHQCRQVVVLGAGLDARALRLHWPTGTRLFEIDTGSVLQFKQNVLDAIGAGTPPCQRTVIEADLLSQWPHALQQAGFDTNVKTVWVAEGLLMYFTAEQNDTLLASISDLSAVGSKLAMTLTPSGHLARLRASRGERRHDREDDPLNHERVHSLWKSEGPEDPQSWLAGHGWASELFDPEERARAYGRGALVDEVGLPMRLLISAERK